MRSDLLNLRTLKAFQLVSRHGSLRVAAARLRLTVPAVSFQIKRLEEWLEVQLFHRLPGGLVLTDAGERFVPEVDGIFEKVESALGALPSKPPPSGHLSIAASSDVIWYFTPQISHFIKRYPRVRLHSRIMHSKEIMAQMLRGNLDVGIGYFKNPPRSLQQEVVVETRLTLACAPGHPLLRQRPIRLDDLAKHKLIVQPQLFETRRMIDRAFLAAGIKVDDLVEAGNCQTARDLAERGVGAAIIHSVCVRHQRSKALRYVEIAGLFQAIDFSVIYRKDALFIAPLQGFLESITRDEAH